MSELTHVNKNRPKIAWYRFGRRLMAWLLQRRRGPWADHKRSTSVVKRSRRRGDSITITTQDGFDLTITSSDIAVGTGDVLTIWGNPPENVRGLAVGQTVVFWCSEQDYADQLKSRSSEYLETLRTTFADDDLQKDMWKTAVDNVHPELLKRLDRLAASTDDFWWRNMWREVFVSIDATRLSKVFRLRGDYYTLRSSPTWRGLKQAIEWKYMDAAAAAGDDASAFPPRLAGPHTAVTLDLALTLAERLAKGELEGIIDIPAIQDDEPPRLLDAHTEAPPFPIYLTPAAPPMRMDEPAEGEPSPEPRLRVV